MSGTKKSSGRGPAARSGRAQAKSSAKSKKQTKWPRERQLLFRPDRYKYVRSKKPARSACVFCLNAEEPLSSDNLFLYRDDFAQVVMNKFPYNAGHLLVLPTRHESDLLSLSREESSVIGELIKHCVRVLRLEYSPQAFNIGVNLGSAAGAGLPGHLHYHVVPRWNGDTNFFPLIAETKVIMETLPATYDRLAPHFKDFQIEK